MQPQEQRDEALRASLSIFDTRFDDNGPQPRTNGAWGTNRPASISAPPPSSNPVPAQPRSSTPQRHQSPPPQAPYSVPSSRSGRPREVVEVDADLLVRDVNPEHFMRPPENSKCFVIKSYSEEDIHKAVKYSIWSSSKFNNEILDQCYYELNGDSDVENPDKVPAFLDQPMVYLFFSVNGSGHFCGVARMAGRFNEKVNAGVWCHDKWRGIFKIRWLYVKDVPNAHLRHIRLPNNDNKPVTNTRDCQEVLSDQGAEVLRVIHHFQYTTTLFDDFDHYDNLERDGNKKKYGT